MAQRLFRLLFWVALVACFAAAIVPTPPMPGSDKMQHFAAFLVLTILALLAYWRARMAILFASFAAYGLLMETVQGQVGRDADAMDWVADMAAVAAVLALAWLLKGRLRAAA